MSLERFCYFLILLSLNWHRHSYSFTVDMMRITFM
ncbi:hypothetical protein F4W09_05805 [Acinetobacter tandoii]|uniref:Uncharacterized protein n=1 Tax=Acinetobacter tandoii TaxID=202954 RepID=A0A5N4WR27_9GAMM|nr:hypothetical protein F4W09_05805 [Acinetobacter tandoii]